LYHSTSDFSSKLFSKVDIDLKINKNKNMGEKEKKKKKKEGKRIKLQVIEEENDNSNESEKKEEVKEKGSSKEIKTETPTEDKSIKDKDNNSQENIEKPKAEKLPFWVLFIAFVIGLSIGAGLIGGIFYYRSKVSKTDKTANIKPTSTPLSTPEITVEENTPEEKKIDLSKYKVQVLNGSGIKGLASKTSNLLEETGFKDIKVGNAGSYDYTKTEISFKDNVEKGVFENIKDTLSNYDVEKGDNLKDTSNYDIVIIVGKTQK